MVDNLSKDMRSKVMASIRSRNTRPELAVRKLLWTRGKRYRVHDRTVYGIPDISNKKAKVAVFIDGCFWHGCEKCYKEPSTNTDYWRAKMNRNKERRIRVVRELEDDFWTVLQFWEHEVLSNHEAVVQRISVLM